MPIKTFGTRKAAKAEQATMKGWETSIIKFRQPENPQADRDGKVYAIDCGGGQYLQTDGFVR